MVMDIGFPFEAWDALIKMTAQTNDEATYRVKKGLRGFDNRIE